MLKIEYIPISEIKPYDKNPRKNDRAVDIVVKSIKEFGFNVPILLDKNNIIIAGHTRLKAAIKLGLTEVPILWLENLTEEQAKAFRIMDNKSMEYSLWDVDLLKNEFANLRDMNYDLSFTGFSESEINKIMPSGNEDDFEIPKEAKYKIELGEIYQLGNHRLMCGDSTKEIDVALLFGQNKWAMILTDPPYNVNYSSKNELLNLYDNGNRIQDEIVNDNFIDRKSYNEFIKQTFSLAKKYATEYNSIYAFGIAESLIELYYFPDIAISNMLVWVKNNIVLGRQDYKGQHEFILYGWFGRHRFYGLPGSSTVLRFDKPQSSKLHPTMKPIELLSYLIKNSSNENETILDMFGGSGSTLIACEQTKRNCYTMEIDPFYCSVIIERWENLTGKTAVKVN